MAIDGETGSEIHLSAPKRCSDQAGHLFIASRMPSSGCSRMISLFGIHSAASGGKIENGNARYWMTISDTFCGRRLPVRR
jgi:hypothetical protein